MTELFEKMGIDVGLIVVFLMLIVIVLIILIMKLQLQVTRLDRKYRMFMRGSDGQSLEKLLQRKLNVMDKIADNEEQQTALINKMKEIQEGTMNKYGIVKYDAFDDVGGKLSFALAMLDKNDTGLVLNAVHSRDNCFLYIKEIVKGESYIMLSEEEIDALREAKGSRD